MRKEEAPIALWQILSYSHDVEEVKQTREELIVYYQFLVKGMARKFKVKIPSWISDDELISYGQIGLIKAVDRYDYEQGPFSSFASAYVYGAILDELRSQDWAPRGLRKDQRTLNSAFADLQKEDNAEPTDGQIAEYLDWTPAKVKTTRRKIQNSSHIDLTQAVPGQTVSNDQVEGSVAASSMCELFVEIFLGLPPENQIVLAHRYFLNETMAVVSETVGYPPTMVRQLHSDSVLKVFTLLKDSITV